MARGHHRPHNCMCTATPFAECSLNPVSRHRHRHCGPAASIRTGRSSRRRWTYPLLTAARLFVMVHERSYRGSPGHFRHVIAGIRPRSPAEAFLRLRTLPGDQAQVD
jgi:transposase